MKLKTASALCSLVSASITVWPAWADHPPDPAGVETSGASSFARACATCHGAKGQGDKGPAIVPLVFLEPQVKVIVRGGQGEMPPITKAALSDAEISAIVAYLATLEQ